MKLFQRSSLSLFLFFFSFPFLYDGLLKICIFLFYGETQEEFILKVVFPSLGIHFSL